jgi:molybdopterin-guanine dinucleotide biosynthesis protein A
MAGGRSARMGQPKALLKFGEVTLIEQIVRELKRAFTEIIVVTAPPAEAGFALPELDATIVFDPVPFEGPLLALKLGLEAAQSDIAFVCPCDTPGIRAEVGRGLCAAVKEHDAAIPLIGGRLQPLPAAYRKRCGSVAEALLLSGERRLRALAPLLDAYFLDECEMRKLDPDLTALLDVNTPDDYHTALKRAHLHINAPG